MACSLEWIKQQVPNLQIVGSNPIVPVSVKSGAIAQLVEHTAHNRVRLGSSPSGPIQVKEPGQSKSAQSSLAIGELQYGSSIASTVGATCLVVVTTARSDGHCFSPWFN